MIIDKIAHNMKGTYNGREEETLTVRSTSVIATTKKKTHRPHV